MKCVLCECDILPDAHGWTQGHNAEPLAEGRCCSICNYGRGLPSRIFMVNGGA